jgi:hypothetical protein
LGKFTQVEDFFFFRYVNGANDSGCTCQKTGVGNLL